VRPVVAGVQRRPPRGPPHGELQVVCCRSISAFPFTVPSRRIESVEHKHGDVEHIHGGFAQPVDTLHFQARTATAAQGAPTTVCGENPSAPGHPRPRCVGRGCPPPLKILPNDACFRCAASSLRQLGEVRSGWHHLGGRFPSMPLKENAAERVRRAGAVDCERLTTRPVPACSRNAPRRSCRPATAGRPPDGTPDAGRSWRCESRATTAPWPRHR